MERGEQTQKAGGVRDTNFIIKERKCIQSCSITIRGTGRRERDGIQSRSGNVRYMNRRWRAVRFSKMWGYYGV